VEACEVQQQRSSVDVDIDNLQRLAPRHHRARDRAAVDDGVERFPREQIRKRRTVGDRHDFEGGIVATEICDIDCRDHVTPLC
jgi:hypothetical protein